MKVQTSDDAKLNNCDDKACDVPSTRRSSTPGPYTIDYEIRPAPQAKYVNLSKLVLLILAIIATFLACLIFARDLWGQKTVEKPEVVHHHAPHVMAPLSHHRFPFEDFLDEMNDPFDFPGKDEGAKSEGEPHLVKTTKITFKLMPKDGEELPGAPFGLKKIGFGGSDVDDGFFDDILKTVMGLASRPEGSFGDLPFFDGPNNPRPMHPKLIILKKLPSPQQHDDDVFKNLLTELNSPVIRPADKYKRPVEPFPLFPMIRPVQRMNDAPSDDKMESLISKLVKDFGMGRPLGRVVIKKKPLPPAKSNAELSGLEGWNKYKSLISKLAQEVDLILGSAATLKQTVIDELNKIKDETPEAPGDGSNVPKLENPSKDFLSNCLESMNKIVEAMTDASIVIKTEDGAMDLVDKSDKTSLVNTIESFVMELNRSLGEVFGTSTALTKMAGKDGVSQPVLRGIVGLASKIVDFGKLIYDDISKLASTVGDSPNSGIVKQTFVVPSPPQPVAESKPNPEPVQPSNDAPVQEPEKNIVFFNAEPIESAQPEGGQK